MNKIRSLSEQGKTYLILVAVTPFYLSYILWTYYVAHYDPMPGLVHMDKVLVHIPVLIVVFILNGLMLLLNWTIGRYSLPIDKRFRQFSGAFTVFMLTYMGYHIGALAITSGVVLMSATILGLMLFELSFVIILTVLPIIVLFGSSILAALGYIEYSPIFVGSPTGGEHPDLFWVLSMTAFSLPLIILFFLFSLMMVTQWRAYDRKILNMASVDPLTQLKNRRFLMESFQRELVLLERHRSQDVAIACIILDLDHFKQVNDIHGHQVGDEVLMATAKALEAATREYDIVGRYGGEEFLIVLPKTAMATALVVAERCRDSIARLRFSTANNEEIRVTASLGVASIEQDQNISMEQMIHSADQALYSAKKAGRNQVVQGV